VAVGAVALVCVGAIGASVVRVSVAVEVEGGEEVSGEKETVGVNAPSKVEAGEPVSDAVTGGVEVEETKGGAFSMYEPEGCNA
jgi:hypothetical protein